MFQFGKWSEFTSSTHYMHGWLLLRLVWQDTADLVCARRVRLGTVKEDVNEERDMTTATRCVHCDSPIIDPTTQVIHGGETYCCSNCSAAMEQQGAGSDPQTRDKPNELKCAHCGSPIVDESSMETRGERAFCCRNCEAAMRQ
jgi:hypothetical protein